MQREIQRRAGVGEDDRLVFLREADERRRLEIEGDEGFERGADLAATAVDHDEIGQWFALVAEAAVAAADDFLHRAEIIVTHEAFDLETAVVVLVGAAVGKRDHRGDDEGAGNVGDIEALQRSRWGFERENLAEQAQGFGACIGERQGGIGALEVASFCEGLAKGEDDVAKLGGFFVANRRG